ncbi:hypothetical protein A0H81_13905 [Grifola frondosa]|uniref:Uncharacterized protein n=1 Tax=Grifola frondosa TaxID=5627 RepID=A0A1C7LQ41_GRIFR|nr:hypothetical protein A0H81_13905 [Grifola frondosa]
MKQCLVRSQYGMRHSKMITIPGVILILSILSDALKAGDSNSFIEMFFEDAFWRDILAFSWDYRSIRGTTAIRSFFDARAIISGLSVLNVAGDQFRAPILSSPFPDVSWIQFGFDLQISAAKGLGYARLVPTENGKWKAFTLLTTLESLNGVIEKALHFLHQC